MKKPIIEVKNLSKRYYLPSQKPSRFLRDELERFIRNPRQFFSNDKKEFWALKDINLSIKSGETIGIIGPNGAGKSTLLKTLAGIIIPTSGIVILRGTVGSLLEMGIGFHPELTGKENIYLSGVTLGIKKDFIDKQFNNIVGFSGIGQFLNVPVKYYSSGMYVRLAFAVTAHLESDIFLVDEVLAVGDEEFQKKCIAKMKQIIKEGRTILFVSHNLTAIENLCQRCILLEKGQVRFMGKTSQCIDFYHRVK